MGELKPEPSMEDILASIKRIIADDSQAVEEDAQPMEQTANKREMSRFGGEPLQLVEEMKTEQPAVLDEILELTQTFEPAESVEPKAAEKPTEPAQIEVARPVEAFVSRNVTSPMPTPVSSIVSDDTTSASRQSLAALSALLVKADPEAGENTLEGLVREMLRPMMKEWLDSKLPELVERLVEKEIARITGRIG